MFYCRYFFIGEMLICIGTDDNLIYAVFYIYSVFDISCYIQLSFKLFEEWGFIYVYYIIQFNVNSVIYFGGLQFLNALSAVFLGS